MRKSWLTLAGIAVLVLTGCGSYFYNNGNFPTPAPPNQCLVPSKIVLVYPQANATAVPTSATAAYIALPAALSKPARFNLVYVTTNVQLYGGALAQVQYGSIPTPNKVPSYSSPVYYSSPFNAALSAGTQYSIYWNNATSDCVQGPANFIGSFTTAS
jgi:hypothetical protein